ncbi:hypothetical protein OH76DRAFT_1183676 [Lentinus brumalis]|uniref:Uncharacterized protein n=1 Tax=Lentinus brumalis TaxID=2498619 RepID=A0A371CTV9_9APHY|nr:hypothetical protein OH76DRAFT_1183676 [Polyporus brumalis]
MSLFWSLSPGSLPTVCISGWPSPVSCCRSAPRLYETSSAHLSPHRHPYKTHICQPSMRRSNERQYFLHASDAGHLPPVYISLHPFPVPPNIHVAHVVPNSLIGDCSTRHNIYGLFTIPTSPQGYMQHGRSTLNSSDPKQACTTKTRIYHTYHAPPD